MAATLPAGNQWIYIVIAGIAGFAISYFGMHLVHKHKHHHGHGHPHHGHGGHHHGGHGGGCCPCGMHGPHHPFGGGFAGGGHFPHMFPHPGMMMHMPPWHGHHGHHGHGGHGY